MEGLGLAVGLAIVGLAVVVFYLGRIERITILEYERGVLFRDGRLRGVLEPGRHWHIPRRDKLHRLDLRPVFVVIGSQEVLTADNASLKLSAVAQYRIADPLQVVRNSQHYYDALYLAIQLALRNVIGQYTLDQVLAKRQALGEETLLQARAAAQSLGLELQRLDLRDVTLTGDLKRAYAQVLQAQKEGLAALEKARGESAALRHLANAARMINNNPSLLYLRTLLTISESKGNTIVLSLPPTPQDLPLVPHEQPSDPAPS